MQVTELPFAIMFIGAVLLFGFAIIGAMLAGLYYIVYFLVGMVMSVPAAIRYRREDSLAQVGLGLVVLALLAIPGSLFVLILINDGYSPS